MRPILHNIDNQDITADNKPELIADQVDSDADSSGEKTTTSDYSDSSSSDNFTPDSVNNMKKGKFMYIPVTFGKMEVGGFVNFPQNDQIDTSGLIDSGCNVNIMSESLYNALPSNAKVHFQPDVEGQIILASNQSVKVLGTAKIKAKLPIGKTMLKVVVMQDSSHPLILGCSYLESKGIILDYQKYKISLSRTKVRTKKQITIAPHGEAFLWVKVPKKIPIGVQGLCTAHKLGLKHGLIIVKSVGTVSTKHTVPVKVMNVTDESVTLGTNKVLGKFDIIDGSYDCVNVPWNVPMSSHVDVHTGAATAATGRATSAPSWHGLPGDRGEEPPSMSSREQDYSTKGDMTPDAVKSEFDKFISYFDFSDADISDAEKTELQNMLFNNRDIFVTAENPNLGFTDWVQHHIHLKPDLAPKQQRPYRLSPDKKEVLRHQLEELYNQGIITPVSETEDLPITSPVVLVSKRTTRVDLVPGSKEASLAQFRFCCDFRHLNSQTQDFHYNIPDLQELTESFSARTPNYLSTLDISSAFFQLGISPESSRYTAFSTCFGTYKFLRMPQGLKTASATLQLLVDKCFKGLNYKTILTYMDDGTVFSPQFSEHLSDLQEVFSRLRAAGLKLGPRKCKFAQSHCLFLGHDISKHGLRPPPDRVKAIADYPPPTNATEVRRLMGTLNFFNRFIPNVSAVSYPINKLLKDGVPFEWKNEQQDAMDKLKQLLINSPVLAFPRYDLMFRLAVDTSSRGIGFMLYQIHPAEDFPPDTPEKERMRVVRFGSKSLKSYQQSYGPCKLELLGMTQSILECASYLRGTKFLVECDHQALKPLFQKKMKGAIYERWLATLMQFNFDIFYKPASQMVVPDALSRCHPNLAGDNSVSSPEENDPFFPYVTEQVGNIHLPGGINIQSLLGQTQEEGLQVNHAVQDHIPSISSQIDNCFPLQHNDDYDADDDSGPELGQQKLKVKRVAQRKQTGSQSLGHNDNVSVSGKHRPCQEPEIDKQQTSGTCGELDSSCDTHSQGTMTNQDIIGDDMPHSPITVTPPNQVPPINKPQGETTKQISGTTQLMNIDLFNKTDLSPTSLVELQSADMKLRPMIHYLQDGTIPEDSQKQARRIILESDNFVLIDNVLFHSRVSKGKRIKDLQHYQLVLPEVMIKSVIEMYHNSPMAGHSGIQDTMDRIREHYYFYSLGKHITDFVRSCHECQSRKMTKAHTKTGIVAYPTPSGPWEVVQADLYGPLPPSPQGHSTILTVTDMYSKYVMAIPLANKDSLSVATALFQVFCTVGVCDTLITDQGSENTAAVMAEVCRLMQIPQQFTPAFVHHCLGACERTHRTIAERLTPYMDGHRHNWEDMLPAIIFSCNNSVNSSSGFSPHEIIYGQRPKFPLANHLPSRELKGLPADTSAYIKQHVKKLQIIREQAKANSDKSKARMVSRVNDKTNPLSLQPGDFVYLRDEPTGPGRKLQKVFSGPYVVGSLPSPHMAILKNPQSNTNLKHPIHLDRLKMAFVREPNPCPYFLDKVTTNVHDLSNLEGHNTATEQEQVQQVKSEIKEPEDPSVAESPQATIADPPRRSARQRQKPDRFQAGDHNQDCIYSSNDIVQSDSVHSDSRGYHKIKRVLGRRRGFQGMEYLVHICGEASQKAFWVPESKLDYKARKSVQAKPPAWIENV